MTRTQTIAIITKQLEAIDDVTLEAAAERLSSMAQGADITADDLVDCLTAGHALPRPLSKRELEQIEEAREDFRTGRTLTPDELEKFLNASAAKRASARMS